MTKPNPGGGEERGLPAGQDGPRLAGLHFTLLPGGHPNHQLEERTNE